MNKLFINILFVAITIFPIFAFADSVPTASTAAATSINSSSASLNANITPNGPATNAWFEYGTVQPISQTTVSQNAGSGYNQLNFSFTVANLQPNTAYYFRVVAQNQYGTVYGNTVSFFTGSQGGTNAPVVVNQTASNISAGSAALTGTIQPNGSPTSVWFDYGTTTSLGQQTAIQNAGNGTNAVNVYSTLANLQANTTYYFRAVAQNQYGTAYGSVINFFTSGSNSATAAPTIVNFYVNAPSGTINATVDPHSQNVDAWVEYGTTAYLGQTTAVQTFQNSYGATAQFVFNLSNLNSGVTYYFRVVARNSYGTIYGNIANFTASSQYQPAPAPTYSSAVPTAITKAASETDESSARLNSSVNPNGAETTAWFEFGRSYTLRGAGGNRSLGFVPGETSFAIVLIGLKPGTAYYYRVAAKNSFGIKYGNILSFTTSGTSIDPATLPADGSDLQSETKPTIEPAIEPEPKTEIGNSDATIGEILTLKTDNDTPTVGSDITLTVEYKNPNGDEISQAKIIITLPPSIDYLSSSIQPASKQNNVLTFEPGNLGGGAKGAINVKGNIKKNAGSSLTFSASMQYRDASGASRVTAVDTPVELIRVKSPLTYNLLSASVSKTFSNVPGYVWFFAILILVALGGAAAANVSK